MKKTLLSLMALGLLAAHPALAAPACYSAEEIKAENVLRLHSELMVATVTCKQSSTGRDLGAAYSAFTQKNLGPIKGAEGTLISHYQKTRSGKGISHLDVLRTKLANEIGQKMADISAPVFCGQMRDTVTQLADSQIPQLSEYASATYAGAKTLEPACAGVTKAAAVSPSNEASTSGSKPSAKEKTRSVKKSS